jgi:YebC/PmpR family DNA-binding regulatory protein
MSGHSKWQKIRRSKGATDQKRGTAFSKLAKEIQMAVKAGGANPDANLRLKNILLKAKEISMPADTVKRAINKGTGAEASAIIEEVTYEGYGPSGVAFLVETLTDNRNRTGPEIRSLFSKNGGNMAESGAVAFLFEKRGQIFVKKDVIGEDDLMSLVLDAGAEDLKTDNEESFEVVTPPDKFHAVKDALEAKKVPVESAELTRIPKTTVALDEKKAGQALNLYDLLDENEDVQNVYANFDIGEEVLAKLGK